MCLVSRLFNYFLSRKYSDIETKTIFQLVYSGDNKMWVATDDGAVVGVIGVIFHRIHHHDVALEADKNVQRHRGFVINAEIKVRTKSFIQTNFFDILRKPVLKSNFI